MLAIMLLKASDPGRVVVGGGAVVVDVVSEEAGVLAAGFKGGGREPRPRLKNKLNEKYIFFPCDYYRLRHRRT